MEKRNKIKLIKIIVDHLADTTVIMDLDRELEELIKKLEIPKERLYA